MPTYEAECRQCAAQFEFIAPMAESNKPPLCECGGEADRVILSAPSGYVRFPAAGGQGYVSHTSGKFIDTERARRDDLKRTGCRPWEGMDQELKQKAKDMAHEDKKSDDKLEVAVRQAYADLPPAKKAVLSDAA